VDRLDEIKERLRYASSTDTEEHRTRPVGWLTEAACVIAFEDVPWLIAEVERLRSDVAVLQAEVSVVRGALAQRETLLAEYQDAVCGYLARED